jgi:acyl dehydratase
MSIVGRTYPPRRPYEVGAEKIREFATAIGESGPLHHDSAAAHAAGYAGVVAPPTFAIVLGLDALDAVIADPDSGLDYARIVHSDQGFEYRRPIVAGDVLTATVSVTAVKVLMGNTVLTARTEVTDATGDTVVELSSTLVSRAEDE